LNIKRFRSKELTSWPKNDANIILVTEILLMFAFLSMNAADGLLQVAYANGAAEAKISVNSRFLQSCNFQPLYTN
jgi:hypothetical protein